MKRRRWLPVLVLVIFCPAIFAQEQKEDEAAKEKQRRQMVLFESVLAEAREFRLPENRAVAYAKLGSRLWDIDQKRARDLFHDAVNELIGAQTAAEAARKTGSQNDLLTGQSTRPQLLQTIAARDAEFALQSLFKTRPALIEKAIANSGSRDPRIRNYPGNDLNYARGEQQLEQTLIRMAADQSPEKAIALLKSALKSGVTGETFNLLKKLFEKDPAAANDLAAEVAGQLARKSFLVSNQPDYHSIQIATSILSEHVRERPAAEKVLQFDASQMRSLAEKLTSFLIERGGQYGYGLGPQIIQIAEKLAPSAVEKLKEVEKALPRRGFHGVSRDPELAKLLNGETPIEEMLAGAAKLPVESRMQVYQQAANKLAGSGDFTSARSLLSEHFSGDALENAENSLNWTYSQHLINAGRFEEAEALIDEFPDSNRIQALISLANSVFGRDTEKYRSYAVALLEKARSQLPPKPENNNEMSQLMQVIGAYSRIAPPEAFRLFEGLIQPINDVAEASVIVSGFQGGYSVRQGETLISQGHSPGIYFDLSIFKSLAESDFDRTLNMLGGFSRREMRVNIKQQLLDSL